MTNTKSYISGFGETHRRSVFRAASLALALLVISACGGSGSSQTSPRVNGDDNPATPNESNRPFAANDVFQRTNDGSESSLDVLNNDVDPNGRAITVLAITTAADQGGTVTISTDGSEVRYTPANGFSGVETFSYSIRNSDGLTSDSPATVRISVGAALITIPPTPVPDVFTVLNDDTVHPLNVVANDIDINNAIPLTVTSVTSQANGDGMTEAGGTVTIGTDAQGNSIVNYTAPMGFTGPDSFQYTIRNANGVVSTTPGIVTLIVSPIAPPPVPLPDVFPAVVNSSGNMINVLSNDVNLAGGALRITNITRLATAPDLDAEGTFSIGTNTAGDDIILYAPEMGFIGVETLSYEITDANGMTGTGTLTISVLPVGAPPVALPDVAVTMTNIALTIQPLTNDVTLVGGELTITNVTNFAILPDTTPGTFTFDDTTITYTPPTNFIGVETLQYSIEDANGGISMSTIVITVLGVPTALPPIALPDVGMATQNGPTITINVTANDADPAGLGLTLISGKPERTVPDGPLTSVVAIVDGQLNYTPRMGFFGVEILSYIIRDGNDTEAMGSVVITVTPTDLVVPPVALPDTFIAFSGTSNNEIPVLANDLSSAMPSELSITDVSSTLTAPSVTAMVPMTNTAKNLVLYTPPSDTFVGVETLSYTITDANGGTSTSTVIITVVPALAGLPPVALPDTRMVGQGSAAMTFDVLDNDIDNSGSTDPLQLTVENTPMPGTTAPMGSPGTVSVVDDKLVYEPADGFAGVEIIMYTVTDGAGASATGTLVVTVSPIPLPPIAVMDAATVMQDSDLADNTITVLANDADPAMTMEGLTVASNPAPTSTQGGTVQVNMDGTLSYAPADGFFGVDTLQYTIINGNDSTATGIVIVIVSPLPLPPIATLDIISGISPGDAATVINVLANDLITSGPGTIRFPGVPSSTSTPPTGLPGLMTTALAGSPGSLSLSGDGTTLSYTPGSNSLTDNGVVTFSYVVRDANGAESAATLVTLVVGPVP